MVRAGVHGASGYIGGELIRLLLGHPMVELAGVASAHEAGRRVDGVHPNLRGLTALRFCPPQDMPECDVVFFATRPGTAMTVLPAWTGRARCLIDLSPDFRLRDPQIYERYYHAPHSAAGLLPAFVPGWPERHRQRLAGAELISVPGCMAMAAILSLYPLAAAGLLVRATVDGRVGSSGSGPGAGASNLHAERSGALRVFAPTKHRHEAEVAQELGCPVSMTATGVEAVRGVQVVCRAEVTGDPSELELRRLYRERYAAEPFVRLVARRTGLYRLPEPKILAGSNFCDVGMAGNAAASAGMTVAVVVAALDNLMKGGAGNAVQCLNVRMGWPERTGLEFPGLHPV